MNDELFEAVGNYLYSGILGKGYPEGHCNPRYLKLLREAFLKTLEARGSQSSWVGEEEPSIFKKLSALICRLGLGLPPPRAIWFVQRPAEYLSLLQLADDKLNYLANPVRLGGLPIYHLTSPLTADEYAAYPEFVWEPGIWIEMSDGPPRRLKE